MRGFWPPGASGDAVAHPSVHCADGPENDRTTPKILFDHAWLRPVSDHYIDFINPVLRSLKAWAWGAREWMLLDFPGVIRVFFRWLLGGYLGDCKCLPASPEMQGRGAPVLARQHIIFRRGAAAAPLASGSAQSRERAGTGSAVNGNAGMGNCRAGRAVPHRDQAGLRKRLGVPARAFSRRRRAPLAGGFSPTGSSLRAGLPHPADLPWPTPKSLQREHQAPTQPGAVVPDQPPSGGRRSSS